MQAAQADVDALQVELQNAQNALATARDQTSSTAFAAGAGSLLGAPTYSDGYVFPVGGGPGLVHVGHTHHDYPAADIAAPEGSQLYALSNGTVTEAWPAPAGNCGIGFTIATTDGLTWTYCHLSYLEPAVVPGASLAAGTAGRPRRRTPATPRARTSTSSSIRRPAIRRTSPGSSPSPARRFSWLDSIQTNAAPNPVFAVVGDAESQSRSLDSASIASGQVVYFTASGG